jgi:hypothetical protein
LIAVAHPNFRIELALCGLVGEEPSDRLQGLPPDGPEAARNLGIVRIELHCLAEVARGLTNGVGRSLKPLFTFRRLLSGQHFDEPAGKQIHAIRLCDVAVE